MFKEVIAGIKNLWKWRKVIYNDRDWDHWYIYEILKTKLQHQSEHFLKHGYTERASLQAAKMLECIELIKIVQNEENIDLSLDKPWTVELIDENITNHDKARKKLFRSIEENIEQWWD
jgi:hypothetical protein